MKQKRQLQSQRQEKTTHLVDILKSHGIPNVIGILTNFDLIKCPRRSKPLKNLFQREIYQGAKLFYLSGVLNGRYPDTNLFLLKLCPLIFWNAHSYFLANWSEDITLREHIRTSKCNCDRTISPHFLCLWFRYEHRYCSRWSISSSNSRKEVETEWEKVLHRRVMSLESCMTRMLFG